MPAVSGSSTTAGDYTIFFSTRATASFAGRSNKTQLFVTIDPTDAKDGAKIQATAIAVRSKIDALMPREKSADIRGHLEAVRSYANSLANGKKVHVYHADTPFFKKAGYWIANLFGDQTYFNLKDLEDNINKVDEKIVGLFQAQVQKKRESPSSGWSFGGALAAVRAGGSVVYGAAASAIQAGVQLVKEHKAKGEQYQQVSESVAGPLLTGLKAKFPSRPLSDEEEATLLRWLPQGRRQQTVFEVSKEGSTVWAKVGDSLYKFEPNVSEEAGGFKSKGVILTDKEERKEFTSIDDAVAFLSTKGAMSTADALKEAQERERAAQAAVQEVSRAVDFRLSTREEKETYLDKCEILEESEIAYIPWQEGRTLHLMVRTEELNHDCIFDFWSEKGKVLLRKEPKDPESPPIEIQQPVTRETITAAIEKLFGKKETVLEGEALKKRVEAKEKDQARGAWITAIKKDLKGIGTGGFIRTKYPYFASGKTAQDLIDKTEGSSSKLEDLANACGQRVTLFYEDDDQSLHCVTVSPGMPQTDVKFRAVAGEQNIRLAGLERKFNSADAFKREWLEGVLPFGEAQDRVEAARKAEKKAETKKEAASAVVSEVREATAPEKAKVPTPSATLGVMVHETVGQGGQAAEAEERPEWLDHTISDTVPQANRNIGELLGSVEAYREGAGGGEGSLVNCEPTNFFRVGQDMRAFLAWVRVLGGKTGKDGVSASTLGRLQEATKSLPVVERFWLYELASSRLTGERQRTAQDFLLGTFSDLSREEKNELDAYLRKNRGTYPAESGWLRRVTSSLK
jgi:hypothetical protein